LRASTYITHVTLGTGHSRRSLRDEVRGDVMDVVAPWLSDALVGEAAVPLPVEVLSEFTAQPLTTSGGLVVTVSGPDILSLVPDPGGIPLVTFGVARRSRGAGQLWDQLAKASGATTAPPPVPWCAVIIYPTLKAFPDAANWLGDFERCVAWAWIERAAD
jgi:hypothetical protein